MSDPQFRTQEGKPVPALTAKQMREVDRIAVDEFGLGILQMMEKAGRNLAANVIDMLKGVVGEITVLAGAGGNGGGGLCGARHLHNRGFRVNLVLDREASELRGAAADQLRILRAAELRPLEPSHVEDAMCRSDMLVDALIGYSLSGAPRGRAAELIDLCNANRQHRGHATKVLSLDVPSGLNATTGEAPGRVVHGDRTLTLALPKTGLASISGPTYVADIGIPPEVYQPLGLRIEPFFEDRSWVRLADTRAEG
jgi:NAD(P)H-hydrate epimerase